MNCKARVYFLEMDRKELRREGKQQSDILFALLFGCSLSFNLYLFHFPGMSSAV